MKLNPSKSHWDKNGTLILRITWIFFSLLMFSYFIYFEDMVTNSIFIKIFGDDSWEFLLLHSITFISIFIITLLSFINNFKRLKNFFLFLSIIGSLILLIFIVIFYIKCGSPKIRDDYVIKADNWLKNTTNFNSTIGQKLYELIGGNKVTEKERKNRLYEFISDRTDDLGHLLIACFGVWIISHFFICSSICTNNSELNDELKNSIQIPIINDEI